MFVLFDFCTMSARTNTHSHSLTHVVVVVAFGCQAKKELFFYSVHFLLLKSAYCRHVLSTVELF